MERSATSNLAVTYTVQALDARGLKTARKLCAQYRDLQLGLADASMVVLADQWSTRSLATFDHRHFRTVTALDGEPFALLPADDD